MTRRLLLLIGLVIGTSSLGMAGACAAGSMATYTAPGFSCTISNLTFSNFSYSSVAFGGAAAIPASGVGVTLAGLGFRFEAPWLASAAQSTDSTISYTVTAAPGTPSITDLLLTMSGSGFSGTGEASVAEDSLSPLVSLLVFNNSTGFVPTASATFAGVSSLTVTKDIGATGGGTGTGHLSVVFNQFSTGVVPEPSSMLLLGSGLLGLAGFVRRRRGSHSA